LDNPLHKPHPFILNVGSILLPGFIAFLLILVFAPFGFSDLELANRVILSVMFGLISSFGILMVIGLLKWLFPGFMQEESWTVGKELMLISTVVAGICLLNFGVILVLGLSETPISELFKLVVLYTLGISIIPVGVLVLFEQFTHQRKKLQQAQNLTKQLRKRSASQTETESHATPSGTIAFEAENGNVELQLQPEEILLLNSDGNYVEVYYQQDGNKTQKKLIRNRLKNFIPVLPKTSFFRCHKSYIVNKMHIIQVEGNARNLELILRGTDQRIPVSRSKSEALSEFLKGD
jgi:hypothetical protein